MMSEKSLTLQSIPARDDEHAPRRRGHLIFLTLMAGLLLGLLPILPARLNAASIKGEVRVSTTGGFARLVFRFAEEPEAEVRVSGGIIVISFKKPVDVSVDRISVSASDYVSAARRDPDGTAVRIALNRKVTVNSMAAAERLFVDLLPDTWTGLPPGLPTEVIEDLARRAREADKKLQQQRHLVEQQQQLPPIRVRVGTLPTFTRYVFELPSLIPIESERSGDDLKLVFDAPLRFDLADAQSALPPMVASVGAERQSTTATVTFGLNGKIDVRTFREDNNFVLDVVAPENQQQPGDGPTSAPKSAPLNVEGLWPTATPPPLNPLPSPASAAPVSDPRSGGKAPAPPSHPAAERDNDKPETSAASPPEAGTQPTPAPSGETANAPQAPGSPAESPAAQRAPQAASPGETPATVPPTSEKSKPASAPRKVPTAADPATAPTQQPAGDIAMRPPDANAPVVAQVRRQGDALRIAFPFATPTAAAVFRRVDTLWLIFDASVAIDVNAIVAATGGVVRDATVTSSGDGQVVRIKLDRPKLSSLGSDGATWILTIGDMVLEPTSPLGITRTMIGSSRAGAVVTLPGLHQLHRLSDPEIGDTLIVITAQGPPRGFLRAQDFVEFRALTSTHGVVIQPLADDLDVEMGSDKVVIGRPLGLTLSLVGSSPSGQGGELGSGRFAGHRAFTLDTQSWGFDRQSDYNNRQSELIRSAADAPEMNRTAARLDLARFYLARDMYYEAKGVLDVVLSDERSGAPDPASLVLRAIADIMIRRGEDALKDLESPSVGDQFDAGLWRALAFARMGKWSEAHEKFHALDTAVATLPIELQRTTFLESVRTEVGLKDFGEAANKLQEFETLGMSREIEPTLEVLKGRVAEGLGRLANALGFYHTAANSWDRPAAAQGRLREIVLRQRLGDMSRTEAITALESLTTTWRGDETEIEAMKLLSRFYTEDGRYRDAFQIMRTALAAYPNSEMTRGIQDEAASTFETLFLTGKADVMPAIDALSLFYDFRELTPIGRRGDEMIRRLADRLVSVDLLDQATELLQHQVDNRLQGAARAQVAIRLAIVYLMAHKPDRAIQTLRATRTGDLPNELRNQRLLLEARALSDSGRHDIALEVISNISTPEADRLRADILWAAHRWREAGEQIERMYGERWKEFAPLSEIERADILRAAIAFALGEETLALDRFGKKYAAKMAEGPDRRAFEVVTGPLGTSSAEFADIARAVSGIDTLDSFLRDLRARYPEANPTTPSSAVDGRPVTPPARDVAPPPAQSQTGPGPPPRSS